MKRSEINALIQSASKCFAMNGWTLPPQPRWDVTDFGLRIWREFGLVLVNLAEEPEYCEKLMYAQRGMTTPAHTHRRKKEDIIARWGTLAVQVWPDVPDVSEGKKFAVSVNGKPHRCAGGDVIELTPGWRITLEPGVYHAFKPATAECIIGEVSTANDDAHDNFFFDTNVGRYPDIDEDEPALIRMISDF